MTARIENMAVTSRGIRIGIASIPRQRIEPTQDAERLQDALLSKDPVNAAGHRALPYVYGLAIIFMVVRSWHGWV